MIGREDHVGTCPQPFIAFDDCQKTCIGMIVELSILVSLRPLLSRFCALSAIAGRAC